MMERQQYGNTTIGIDKNHNSTRRNSNIAILI